MFQSAVVKLTAWYVGALLFVCLIFTMPIYNVASARLRRGAERQTEVVRRLPNPVMSNSIFSQLERQREEQLSEDRRLLISSLAITNIIIITAGALASYAFARRTLRPIEEAHDAQVRFTSDASHELRTPLAVMQTEIEVALRKQTITAAEARDILTSNLEEVARLRQLSDQLLSLTRSQHSLDRKPLKLDALVTDETKKLATRFAVAIDTTIQKNVPFEGDGLLLRQALGILIENAATYADVPEVRIAVTLKQIDNDIVLTVADNGKGIPKAELPFIFDRFYRGTQSTKQKPDGHGLGLALAKDIVERHHGQLTVASKRGNGTTFTITL